jgi:2-hydroxy-6-oxonona-2,4-dienedioate hydrolase
MLAGARESSRTVDALGTTLHYHELGAGPPVVLLHAWGPGTTAWLTWSKVLPALSRHFRCLALDLPNFGRSGPLYTDESIHEMQATSAAALMDVLGIDRAHVVGTSQGAQSSLVLAARSPERIDRLVVGGHHLGVPSGEYLLGVEYEEGVKLGSVAIDDPTPANMWAYLQAHLADQRLVTDDLIAYLIDQHTSRPDIAAARAAMSYGDPHDITRELAAFAGPTLIVWGRDDRTCHVEIGIRTLNLMPQSRLIVLRDTGHWPAFERPDEYASHVSTFLRADWA